MQDIENKIIEAVTNMSITNAELCKIYRQQGIIKNLYEEEKYNKQTRHIEHTIINILFKHIGENIENMINTEREQYINDILRDARDKRELDIYTLATKTIFTLLKNELYSIVHDNSKLE